MIRTLAHSWEAADGFPKVNESFGPTLDEWHKEASPGKAERLNFLLRTLGLTTTPAGSVRYQLFHRAASAIITGEQYRAAASVLLIHSFSQERTGWTDYQAFCRLFGADAEVGACSVWALHQVFRSLVYG